MTTKRTHQTVLEATMRSHPNFASYTAEQRLEAIAAADRDAPATCEHGQTGPHEYHPSWFADTTRNCPGPAADVPATCQTCGGTGSVTVRFRHGDQDQDCPDCPAL